MAATLQHPAGEPTRAPSGILLDVARIETVATNPTTIPTTNPTTNRVTPVSEVPPVAAAPTWPEAIHRHAKTISLAKPDTSLITSEVVIDFLPPPARTTTAEQFAPISWSAKTGFSEAGSPQRMRLVGQHGSYEQAVGLNASDDTERAERDTPEPLVRYLPSAGPRRESPPRDIVDLVQRVTGVSVGDAVIDRSPGLAERAAAMGAIAFTERATVHLPAELGDIDLPSNRAVVAHELTHVAQQRALGTSPPAEDSPEGRELEAQAQAVQRQVSPHHSSGGVRPSFLRTSSTVPEIVAGVQRLAHDEDPYAWQRRNPDEQAGATTGGMLGAMFGREFDSESRIGREQHSGEQAWSQAFEQNAALDTLQPLRDHRYRELVEDAEREVRVQSIREGVTDVPELTRADRVHLRGLLDDEMPYEFGPPAGITPYPDVLPAAPETATPATPGAGAASTTPAGRATSRPSAAVRRVGSHAAAAGMGHASHGAGAGRRPGTGGGGSAEESQFDWQHREPTERQAISLMFGASLFGDLFGGAVTGDESDARRAAEAEQMPELTDQRHELERDLRHTRLRSKRTEAAREGTPPAPIALIHAEIVEIRAQVDTDRPLEFATPTYVDTDHDVSIAADGTIGGALPTPEATATPTGATTPATAAVTPTTAIAPTTAPTTAPVAAGLMSGAGTAVATTAVTALTQSDPEPAHDELAGYNVAPDADELEAGRIFSAATDLDLELLSRRLWSRIRRQIRSELLIDRERAGVLADVR